MGERHHIVRHLFLELWCMSFLRHCLHEGVVQMRRLGVGFEKPFNVGTRDRIRYLHQRSLS
jgi:hypothetical protein